MRKLRVLLGVIVVAILAITHQRIDAVQIAATATPMQIMQATNTPNQQVISPEMLLATPTFTPENAGGTRLQALDIANVRALPDTAETQLGVIRAGDFYIVTGQYGNWLQLAYDESPTGFGWVYGELVTVTGDTSTLVQVDPYTNPAASGIDPFAAAAQAESDLPGSVATVTLGAGELLLPDGSVATALSPVLPTFTYPPGVVRAADLAPESENDDVPRLNTSSVDEVPPIVPILVMGGLGLLGLALSSLRR